MTAGAPVDLAVIGGGPRALSALVALDERLAAAPAPSPVVVEVYDPADPGSGAVWDPRQPDHLLLNVNASLVDYRSSRVLHTYQDWARAQGDVCGPPEEYPPRAHVGQYLQWVWQQLLTSPHLVLHHRPHRVHRLRRAGSEWRVEHAAGAGLARHALLTTGHAGGVGANHRAVMEARSEGPLAAGAHVRVRGAALTAIDLVLDLTQGRGGRWAADHAAPSGARYLASGQEPATVTVTCRSGELMVPKPTPGLATRTSALIREQSAALVASLAGPDGAGRPVADGWWQDLFEIARRGAAACGQNLDVEAAWQVLDSGRSPAPEPDVAEQAWHRAVRDLARAEGDLDDDPAWWWGRTWSAVYPEIVHGLERRVRDADTWPVFRTRAARLERWAFGPPPTNLRRLVALHEAGIVHLEVPESGAGHGSGADRRTGELRHDLDSVTVGAGVLEAPVPWPGSGETPIHGTAGPEGWSAHDDLWHDLLLSGEVSVRAGERGVFTRPDGRCVGADGTPRQNLFALGRPTEDPVVGHDTLSRTLHGDVSRWADRACVDLAWRHTTGSDPVGPGGAGAGALGTVPRPPDHTPDPSPDDPPRAAPLPEAAPTQVVSTERSRAR